MRKDWQNNSMRNDQRKAQVQAKYRPRFPRVPSTPRGPKFQQRPLIVLLKRTFNSIAVDHSINVFYAKVVYHIHSTKGACRPFNLHPFGTPPRRPFIQPMTIFPPSNVSSVSIIMCPIRQCETNQALICIYLPSIL